jgi:Holliday junction resolvasome RuvABC DNA-binding subunit
MFHLFHGTLRYDDEIVYIDNGIFGLEVQYAGQQKEGMFFLYPQHDQTHQTWRWFAFDTADQKQRFTNLLKIQWVWTKSAFHIVQCDPQDIHHALECLDLNFFQRIPGVWPKLAKRLLMEMKQTWSDQDVKRLDANPKLQKDIVTALRDLWYPVRQIKELLLEVPYELKKEHLPNIMKWIIERVSM